MRHLAISLALVLFASATSFAAGAQRKPKEIVVVGSKVKDVVREAGLRSDGELVQAVSDRVNELLEEAIRRARQNGRLRVLPHDFEDHACQSRAREIVVVGSKVKDVVRDAGFRAGSDLVAVVSDQVHEILATAIHRAKSNGRKTVRPHDL